MMSNIYYDEEDHSETYEQYQYDSDDTVIIYNENVKKKNLLLRRRAKQIMKFLKRNLCCFI